MGKADKYLKGDWNVICDYCGDKRKQSTCRLTWDNYLVCSDKCWEPRQPQDFVRGKVDKQRTPPHLTRPDDVNNFTETLLTNPVAKGDVTFDLIDVSNVGQYTTIGISMDDTEVIHWSFVTVIVGNTITIEEEMPGPAADANTVYINDDDRFLESNEVSIDDL
jgi:hypothetical protein